MPTNVGERPTSELQSRLQVAEEAAKALQRTKEGPPPLVEMPGFSTEDRIEETPYSEPPERPSELASDAAAKKEDSQHEPMSKTERAARMFGEKILPYGTAAGVSLTAGLALTAANPILGLMFIAGALAAGYGISRGAKWAFDGYFGQTKPAAPLPSEKASDTQAPESPELPSTASSPLTSPAPSPPDSPTMDPRDLLFPPEDYVSPLASNSSPVPTSGQLVPHTSAPAASQTSVTGFIPSQETLAALARRAHSIVLGSSFPDVTSFDLPATSSSPLRSSAPTPSPDEVHRQAFEQRRMLQQLLEPPRTLSNGHEIVYTDPWVTTVAKTLGSYSHLTTSEQNAIDHVVGAFWGYIKSQLNQSAQGAPEALSSMDSLDLTKSQPQASAALAESAGQLIRSQTLAASTQTQTSRMDRAAFQQRPTRTTDLAKPWLDQFKEAASSDLYNNNFDSTTNAINQLIQSQKLSKAARLQILHRAELAYPDYQGGTSEVSKLFQAARELINKS